MRTYDHEVIVLGLVLRYGKDAAGVLLPNLTPDKFVHGFNGDFGPDHSIVWQAISEVFLIERRNPTYVEVAAHLKGEYAALLTSLVDRLEKQYRIFRLDLDQLERFATLIDKQGVVYNISKAGANVAKASYDVDVFMQTVHDIDDIERWATEQLTFFRSVMTMRSSGYTHVSTVVDEVKERWDRQFRGEEMLLLNSGFPSLRQHNLFPARKMAVVHGLSGSGKSTLVFQVNLGTAIHLAANKLKGCVAINSLEMEATDLVERMVGILAHADVSHFIGGNVTKKELDNLFDWADFVAKLPIFVDDTNFLTTSAMEYRASGLHVSEHGPVVQLSSDYGELFKDEDGSEEQRVNKIFREQFRLSREIGCSVIAISQSTNDKNTSGKTYIAGPDGTRYSRGILQAADILCELWNPVQMEAAGRTVLAPDDFSPAHPWLFVQKYRGAKTGAAIPLGWRAETTTFFDMAMTHTVGAETVFDHLDDAIVKMYPERKKMEIVGENADAW